MSGTISYEQRYFDETKLRIELEAKLNDAMDRVDSAETLFSAKDAEIQRLTSRLSACQTLLDDATRDRDDHKGRLSKESKLLAERDELILSMERRNVELSFRADRLEAVLREIANTGTSQPPAMQDGAEWYRSVAWSLIGMASRALQGEQNRVVETHCTKTPSE